MSSLVAQIVPVSEQTPVWAWVRLRALVADSVSSPNSRRAYTKALDAFREWCDRSESRGFTRETVQRYRTYLESRGLAPSSLNLHMTVIRKLGQQAAGNGLLTHETAAAIASVKGASQNDIQFGTWLTLEQAQTLLKAPVGDGLREKRDRALLAVLIGCGLRRNEIAELRCEQVQQREGRWVIVNVEGNGNRIRNVPMPAWAKTALDHWTSVAGIRDGRLFRAIYQREELAAGLSAQAVYLIVRRYAERLDIQVAPDDLRRTFAKLAHRGRSPLEQIQLSLGHKSVLTTERYLGVRQNLTDAPCDHLGIDLENS